MRERLLRAGCIALFVMLQMVTTVYAATPPTYTKLAEFQVQKPPAGIAANATGLLYVARTTSSVGKYTLEGASLGTISLAEAPFSLYAAGNTLYAGQYGRVDKYQDSVLAGSITGVQKAIGMAALSNGSLYVLDADQSNVKIIDASGFIQATIGDASSFKGLLGLAIDEAGGEFFVLDNGELIDTGGGNKAYVWRVQVFDLAGNFKRKFSSDGTSYSRSSIAVDTAQRVYLSDYTVGALYVYDNAGQLITKMSNLPGVDKLAFVSDKLYATAPASKKIYCFGIDNFAILNVNPSTIALQAQGSYQSGDTTLSLANSGTSPANWTIAETPGWLKISPTAGQVDAGVTGSVAVSADTAGLAPGYYQADVLFAYDGRTIKVPAGLKVLAPATLSVTPSNIDLQLEEGAITTQSITISLLNDLSKAMTWNAVSNSSWLTLSSSTGSSNTSSTIDLKVNTAGMAVGTYAGQVTVTSAATGTSAVVTVAITITAKQNPVDPGTGIRGLNIIATHAGTQETSEVAVFDAKGNSLLRFTAFATFSAGANAAVGDFDGDGIPDIIVGTGGGNRVPAAVKIFNRDGSAKKGLAFTAFNYRAGVNVASGDFDGDRKDEIITADAARTTAIRILSYDTATSLISDTGVNFEAYAGHPGGVNVAVADIDGDDSPEIITVPKTGNGDLLIRVFKVDTSAGPGEWKATLSKEFIGCTRSAGPVIAAADASVANIAAADMIGDGSKNIVVACNTAGGPEIKVFTGAGSLLKKFSTGSSRLDYIAAGDVTADGITDIILGDGAGGNRKTVHIMDKNGMRLTGFDAFGSSAGVKVSVGDLGLQGVK